MFKIGQKLKFINDKGKKYTALKLNNEYILKDIIFMCEHCPNALYFGETYKNGTICPICQVLVPYINLYCPSRFVAQEPSKELCEAFVETKETSDQPIKPILEPCLESEQSSECPQYTE